MKELAELDKQLFLKINGDWKNQFFDLVMPFLRQPYFWVPVYIFFLVLVLVNFQRRGWLWVVFLGATASLSDIISSRFIKPAFMRVRPCNEPDLFGQVNLMVIRCGGNGSFTSSHAANHFALSMFIFITLKPYIGNWAYLLFIWAAIVSYAQVYVGVHYPGDVLGGAFLGSAIGYIMAGAFSYSSGKLLHPIGPGA
jgi:undecaprenyl-diphosphatase